MSSLRLALKRSLDDTDIHQSSRKKRSKYTDSDVALSHTYLPQVSGASLSSSSLSLSSSSLSLSDSGDESSIGSSNNNTNQNPNHLSAATAAASSVYTDGQYEPHAPSSSSSTISTSSVHVSDIYQRQAIQNGSVLNVTISVNKLTSSTTSSDSSSISTSQLPSGRALSIPSTHSLSDRELDSIVPTIPPMIMPNGCVVRQAIRHGRVLRVSISCSELTSSDHPSIEDPSSSTPTTYDIDADDNSSSSSVTSSTSSISNNVSNTDQLIATFTDGRPDMKVSLTNTKQLLKKVQKTMKNRIMSAQTSTDDEPTKLFDVVSSEKISIRSDVDPNDIPDDLKHLDGYHQRSGRPDGYDVETACPLNESLYQGEDNFLDSVEHITDINGDPIDWNTLSLPANRDPNSSKKLVALIAYYQTLEERKMCRNLHSFRSTRSHGAKRSATPAFMAASLGQKNFSDCAALDMYPFPMPHGGSPLDVLTQEDFDYVMKMWVKHVLMLLLNDDRVVIALCSKTTGVVFAKHVLRGSITKLHKLYEENPDKFISAVLGKLVLNYHPESIYNLLYWIMMEIKCKTSDAFFTNVLKAVTDDDDVVPCTFAQGLLEEDNNSAAFALVQAAHLEKCRWGAATTNKKRDEAALTYHVHIQAGLTDEQALDCIKYEMGDEYHNLAVGYLKFCWMVKLAVQLERKEEIDMVEVIKFTSLVGMEVEDLMKNAEACRKGSAKSQSKFTATSQLAAQSPDGIDMKEVVKTATQLGMEVKDLMKNVEAWKNGGAKGRAKRNIMAQLSAMLKCVDDDLVLTVDNDVVVEMAARCGMKKDDLLKGAKAIKKGRDKGRAKARAKAVKNGSVSWNTMFEELVRFKDEFGNCNVPSKNHANPQLGNWVSRQRTQYKYFGEGKQSQLTTERVEMLTRIGFIWNHSEHEWGERFDELVEYKKEKGHCNVPAVYDANKQLGNWVMSQREVYKKKDKSKRDLDRIESLTAIGFKWKPRVSWEERFEELVAYKAAKGDCNVPQSYEANPQLGYWVNTQRKQYKLFEEGKKSQMTKERVAKLKSIDFVWKLR